ncbi:MAG: hypothetical protein P8Z37_08445, partial [Acidobacteriota bacterium]
MGIAKKNFRITMGVHVFIHVFTHYPSPGRKLSTPMGVHVFTHPNFEYKEQATEPQTGGPAAMSAAVYTIEENFSSPG